MNCKKLDFRETGLFSKLIIDYIEENPKLFPFYSAPPTMEGFKKAIEAKEFSDSNRSVLVEVLKNQYESIETPINVQKNVDSLLDSNTFTVTTGHQLNIFTGPLFYIYKLVATINLAKKLSIAYPEYRFVPIYWMGAEDHDFDEINHLFIHNKKYQWLTDQTGATGRFNTEGLEEVLNQLPGKTDIFKKALRRHKNLADVVRDYVNSMFGEEGLVCIDGDDARLKRIFLPVIKDELLNERSHTLVHEQSTSLDKAGYKQQLQPRELNLFYLDESLRSRIIKSPEGYSVVDSDLSFTNEKMGELLESNPERFSPNVILRPVYQEAILPNLSYVGGPSELAYWFQLKSVFDHYNIAFPILMPRSFVMKINTAAARKIDKLGIDVKDLFLREDLYVNKYIKTTSNGNLNIEEAKKKLKLLFDDLKEKVENVDLSLGAMVESEHVKGAKSMKRVEDKMLKAEKRNRADELRMLTEIYASLYPNGTPHERRENVLSVDNDRFIHDLLEVLDPLEMKYNILF